MSEANEDTVPDTQPAVEPTISPERVLELAHGNGGASAEEQQVMAAMILKYQLVVGESASRVGAYAFSAASIMQTQLDKNAYWSAEQHKLFQFLVKEIADLQHATEHRGSHLNSLEAILEMMRAVAASAILTPLAPSTPEDPAHKPPEAVRPVHKA